MCQYGSNYSSGKDIINECPIFDGAIDRYSLNLRESSFPKIPFYLYIWYCICYLEFYELTPKEVLKILYKDGWYDVAQKGSHLQLKHLSKKGKVTVSMHQGDIPLKTLKSILNQAQIDL
jgi:predicted RNA binding protein YcfA (HicA-like mRNA interferase family)